MKPAGLFLLTAALLPINAAAQSTLIVRVAADTTARPVANVSVGIPALQRSATTDSSGRAVLERLPAGTHRVVARAIGFRPDSTVVELGEGATREIVMKLATHTVVLEEVRVSAQGTARTGKMAGYHERRERGIGRFIDRDLLERNGHRRTADILNTVPGVYVRYGFTSKAWASSGRNATATGCPTCGSVNTAMINPGDRQAGAGPACYMDVYIDGALVYNSSMRYASLFDLNSIEPGSIEAMEVYSSGSNLPSEFQRTGGACGAVLIWMRVSR
ncbi:MAG TPA: carboxypeptidase regulatory-like domain-containing protein [Gemmatimonadaceae bacterium]|nr:carboxypeptidase regulatory-like domain-containing protein [Gemmatimonadaceae bacterium]